MMKCPLKKAERACQDMQASTSAMRSSTCTQAAELASTSHDTLGLGAAVYIKFTSHYARGATGPYVAIMQMHQLGAVVSVQHHSV